ncbi:MAG: hypothetical protein M1358_13650, partial [Chloroflexi bacterium]|nr:hypothetical protein [Chloroflexota bacterium]
MSVKKRSKKLLIVGIGLVLAAVAVGGVGSSVAQAQGPYFGRSGGPFGGMMGGWGPGGMMGGMMGGWGPGGMMGGYGWGGRSGQPYYGNSTPISIEQATQSVQSYLATGGESDLVPTEVLEFQWNFYAMVKEKSTGVNAFELLVDKYSGAAYPEMGPNMMWNTKYGMMAHMGGMMGGFYWLGASPTQMPVTPKQAQEIAQGYK